MNNHARHPKQVDPDAREAFYQLLGEKPATQAAWNERQATLRSWRSEPRFEPYWASVDHMLGDDFASYQRRGAALESLGDLEGYDYDAWREQREYDLKHANDRLP